MENTKQGVGDGPCLTSDSSQVTMHRLYNPYTGEHFYTASDAERDNLVGVGWKEEGVGWYGVGSSTYSTKQAYAVYSADDQTLSFYKRTTVPTQGSKFEGKTATQVFTGIENMVGSAPWSELYEKVTQVTIVDDGIQPVNMDFWFGCMPATLGSEQDLSLVNYSSLAQISNLEKIDTSKTTINVSSWDESDRAR